MSIGLFDFSTHEQTSNTKLSIANSVTQVAASSCTFSCNNVSSGNTVIVDGTTTGNIDFSQSCSIQGSTCAIKTYLETNVQNMMSAMSQQNLATQKSIGVSIGNFSSDNQTINVEENIYNSMTQLISNNCKMDTNNIQQNNYYYYHNSTIGNITYAQTGSITNADCIMDTIAKATATNDQTSSTTQSATLCGKGSGNSSIFIIVGVIVFIVFIIIGILAYMKSRNRQSESYNAMMPGGTPTGMPNLSNLDMSKMPDLSKLDLSKIDAGTLAKLASMAA